MGRSPVSAAFVGLVGGQSILTTMKFAVLPIAKVFTVCFLGFLMASKHVNILPSAGRKLLNGLVFSLLLPCLIFSQLGRAITLQRMMEWWFIPVNIVLATISGSLIGFLVASVIRPPYPYFKFTIIHIGIGNIGNIPLVLISALCRDTSNPFGDSDKCSEDGLHIFPLANGYITSNFFIKITRTYIFLWKILFLFFLIIFLYFIRVGAIVLYTYVFQMLSPPPGGSFDCTKESALPIKSLLPDLPPEQVPLLKAKQSEPLDLDGSDKGKITHNLIFLLDKLRLKQLLQPPIVATMLAMLFGAVPFLKRLILTDDAPLFFITDSCIILAEAMIPCILLALGGISSTNGGMIVLVLSGPGSSELGVRTTAAIVVGRLVLVPLTGVGIVGNKMFKFVLLLQHSMPTSVLSGAVANLRGCGREAAATLFWVHIFAIFSMAGWIVLYLNILF
ncbi:unnamed protein product [Spirodela intermedia]|uniref:Uncharacterized protein n=1 Tax=Spirodela intermedia TaxID=51605 RepID=A0A7I8IVK8_SPIIN|nr:unnamed protein product [Spirodela intermedia]CAA6661898.1 unnamed protein product [Spirodela intermedia]